jgi:hypothetical protein
MRRAPRLDRTQDAIVDALLGAGVRVQSLAQVGLGVADLLCVMPDGRTVLIECKSPGEKLTPAQVKWHKSWTGELHVVESAEQALAAVTRKGAA